ncbi:MAG: sel1 repeat family protein [Acetobacteraceae bacterium]|nr:MAG: sel1 repeat family protein [Acetobacteraceae bacterium]
MLRLLASVLVVLPLSVRAEPVQLMFEPPQLDAGAVCDPRPSDEALAAKWDGVDLAAVPETDTALIKRDFRRLLEIDPTRWFDVISTIEADFQTLDPEYSDVNMLIDRIELLLAAGRVADLQQERLVHQLADMDLSQTPRAQNLLAGYLMRGVGIDKDEKRGEALLLEAAYGGNADAILALVERDVAGRPVAGWTVEPDLSVTMAFGALVGKLDPLICDRVNRIAREYMNGTIVARDPALAERWFRFSADLGDAVSAWKVAEMHLRSEDIAKDNAVLVHYLRAASDAGLPYAQVALARIMTDGALVPKDLAGADATYGAAGQAWAQGEASHVLFLQAQSRRDPAWTEPYVAALRKLVERPDAPAWALIAMAEEILASKGRWAGEAEAMTLLERAIALGEDAALERTADMRLRSARSPEAFYAQMDQLIQVVVSAGEVDPMLELTNAYICRAPDAPQVAEADYWVQVAESTSTIAVDYTPGELSAMAATLDPIAEAEIQTQALTGRVSAIAQYIYLLERRGVASEMLAFWENYASRFPGVTTARAKLMLEAARSPAQRKAAMDMFRKAIAEGEVSAGTQFAEALLDTAQVSPASQAEALQILLPLADLGSGDAMTMLPLADPVSFPNMAAVMARFGKVIDDRGDFDALLLALPLIRDRTVYAEYVARATAITGCTFDEALRLTDAVGRAGDRSLFERWLRISDYLAQGEGDSLADLADVYGRYATDADRPRILDYYQAARADGSRVAIQRLLNIYSRRTSPQYDSSLAAELFVDLVGVSAPEDLPSALNRLRGATPEIRAIAYRSIDEPALFLTAAKSGNSVAMREYALILRQGASSPAEVLESTDWLRKAAEAGEPTAMVDLAEALVFGIGTTPSRDEALEWLTKAADLGSEDATSRLRSLRLSTEAGQ